MGCGMTFTSCKHDPIIDVLVDPGDTTIINPIDTMKTDTLNPGDTMVASVPCDTNIVYFEMEVLPILKSNCAFSGCHDAASAQDRVILEDYETVTLTADVEPFDLKRSEIYEVLVESDLDKRMPPAPTAPLTARQINIIAKWILQGAEDLTCDPDFNGCDTTNISFSGFVEPLIQNTCQGCHSGNPPAAGIDLTGYDNIKTVAENGRLYGAIGHLSGFSPMPKGGNRLDSCIVDQVKSWIDAGMPNN